MKKFVIETDQNYLEAMKKILSNCRVSGALPAEIKKYLDETVAADNVKTYKCRISGNKITVEWDISYRNSFTSTMDLEILAAGNKTRVNGSISTLFSDESSRRLLTFFVMLGSLAMLIFQTVRFFTATFVPMDWVVVGISAVLFLTFLLTLSNGRKSKNETAFDDPYEVQMEHWISNLFPGEYRSLEE